MMPRNVVMSFSGGKDSSLALYRLQQDAKVTVTRLMTTATKNYRRSTMHGVRIELARAQAASLGLPLDIVWLKENGGAEEYANQMKSQLETYRKNEVDAVAFGDIFLEDVRAYREKMNAACGLPSLFPLWKESTTDLARAFIRLGFKAVVTCVDTSQLDSSFCGKLFDESFLQKLPPHVDPCAENGEFHTFCFDGPLFRHPVTFQFGEKVLRDDRFQYIDLCKTEQGQ